MKKLKLYMCGVAWDLELGNCDVRVFESEWRCKEMNGCTKECGIVAVDAVFTNPKWLKAQKFLKPKKKKS